MEAKANIAIGQVNNQDKQKVSLSYYLGSFDNVKDAQTAKFALDAVALELGASISQEACILGENDTQIAKDEAAEVKLNVDSTEEPVKAEPETPPTAI